MLSQKLLNLSNKKLLFFTFITLLIVWTIFVLAPQLMQNQGGRLILDPADFHDYFMRGKWIFDKSVPLSEYPQIPTYLFGLNHLLSMWFDARIQLAIYISFMSLEMVLVQFFVIKVLLELLPADKRYLSLLMLLPTNLYFVLNRFDILPAFLCLLALFYLNKKRFILASIILAIATFTKWYPILLFPGFLLFSYSINRKIPWKDVLAFLITSILILLPTYLQGGINAILVPYLFHAQRGMEYFSFVVLVDESIAAMIFPLFPSQSLYSIFFGLQILPTFLSLFIKFDNLEAVIDYSILAIACFILFSRIDSPQWVLWLMPFLILSARKNVDIILLILYSLITYLTFPVAFDGLGTASIGFKLFNSVIYIILIFFIYRSLRRMTFSLNHFRLFTNPHQFDHQI